KIGFEDGHIVMTICFDGHNRIAVTFHLCQLLRSEIRMLPVIKPGSIISCKIKRSQLFFAVRFSPFRISRDLMTECHTAIVGSDDDVKLVKWDTGSAKLNCGLIVLIRHYGTLAPHRVPDGIGTALHYPADFPVGRGNNAVTAEIQPHV